MAFLKFTTLFLAAIAIVTGAMDIAIGVAGQANLGVGGAASPPFDPVLDSQIRFLGAVWAGFGLILLVCLRDFPRYAPILRLCFAILVLGGLGRALSLIELGFPSGGVGRPFIVVALAIELLLAPAASMVAGRLTSQRI